jgi:hypothetical protein
VHVWNIYDQISSILLCFWWQSHIHPESSCLRRQYKYSEVVIAILICHHQMHFAFLLIFLISQLHNHLHLNKYSAQFMLIWKMYLTFFLDANFPRYYRTIEDVKIKLTKIGSEFNTWKNPFVCVLGACRAEIWPMTFVMFFYEHPLNPDLMQPEKQVS